MNARDVLTYGHFTLLGAVDGLSASDSERPGACGVWSIKQLVAHLSSYEQVFADILAAEVGTAETPHLARLLELGERFNDITVAERDARTFEETLAEYNRHHEDVMASVAQIPAKRFAEIGSIPSYGTEYALDDLIVYKQYGHKREHAGQIGVFRGNIRERAMDDYLANE